MNSMIYVVKQLIVVLVAGSAVFHFVRPYAIRFSSEIDFNRRRNVWLILSVVVFLSPNFWLFVLLAAPLLAWAGRKDANPLALYLLLMQAAPAVPVNVPMIGINGLLELDYYRLLSFCVLIPAAWRLRRSKEKDRNRGFTGMDVLLLGYGVLQVLLYVAPDSHGHAIFQDSPTNMLRRAFLFFLDIYVLYYVAGRSCNGRRTIVEAMAAFCVSCLLMASLGIFESVRHWLLYADVAVRWANDWSLGFYSIRNGILRAQVAAVHPIVLGYLLAIAFGFWLYLRSDVKELRAGVFVVILLGLCLLATFSRGDWFGAAVIYFGFAALGTRAFSGVLKAAVVAVLVLGILFASPIGERIIQVLPFMGGSVDSDSLLYRERLLTRTWELFQLHPFFGDRLVYLDLEDLRQGGGIIDFVNTYAQITLYYGLAGLSLFLGSILLAFSKAYGRARGMKHSDPEFALVGTSLVACLLGTLVMIASSSFIGAFVLMFYVLIGLAAAYARLGPSTSAASAPPLGVRAARPKY